MRDIVIIGAGTAGLTAAIYACRAGRDVLVLEASSYGGQIINTPDIENYPGIRSVSGYDFATGLYEQATGLGAEVRYEKVTGVEERGDVKVVTTAQGAYEARAVIVATGAKNRPLGVSREQELVGRGVSYCATCDGEFFTGREVFVVGGGFAAAEEAVFLTTYASHVTVLVRRNDFSCARSIADEVRANDRIDVLTNSVMDEVDGDGVVRRVRWHDVRTGETHEYSAEDGGPVGVFVFAGYVPATELVRGVAELDEQGYVVTDERQMTSVDGLFAAGDVCRKRLRQVATAVGEGAATATEMERYVRAVQERTGIVPRKPVAATRLATSVPSAATSGASAGRGSGADNGAGRARHEAGGAGREAAQGPFDEAMLSQLRAVFARMASPLTLRLHLDGGATSRELRGYMEALAAQTDLLSVELAGDAPATDAPAPASGDGGELPFVEVVRADGTPTGLAFHGVPGGHEFTSFVLGLYNAAGPGQPLSDADRSAIARIDRPVSLRVLVGLSCTMCPDVVVACQRMAADNPNVTAHVYDVNRFPELRERYEVMSVPCLVIGDDSGERVSFGKKSLSQILELVG